MIENANIYEETIYEHLSLSNIRTRVDPFLTWLLNREETHIVIVGHSEYFRYMLNAEFKMPNCEVQSCWLTNSNNQIKDCRILVRGGSDLLNS